MACFKIKRIKFDPESIKALKEIHTKLKLYKYLKVAMIGGTLMTILSGKNLKAVHTNIKTTDFLALSKALSGSSEMQKSQLYQIAALQVLNRKPSVNRSFWESMADGCKI